jgi:YbgC/YbaW family acyl-CoA thioester hydrolase
VLGSIHKFATTIQQHQLDSFGHVNNAVYLQLFEEARWDLITQNGYGPEQVRKLKLGPTILEVHLSFKRELLLGQRMTIETWLESYEGKVGRMIQRMVDDPKTIFCEAHFVFGLFDLAARKLVPPTPDWWHAVGLPGAPPAASARSR